MDKNQSSILASLFANLHLVRAQNEVILANTQHLLAKAESTDLKKLMEHQRQLITRMAKEKMDVEFDQIEKAALTGDVPGFDILPK